MAYEDKVQLRAFFCQSQSDVESLDSLMGKRRKSYKQIRRYADFTTAQMSSCGEKSPFCAYGLDTPEGQDLMMMLKRIGYEGDELDYAAHSIWVNAQYEPGDDNLDILLSAVRHDDAILDSYEDFIDCANVIVRYANIVPKWLLKGHSALETGLMMYRLPENYFRQEYEEAENYSEEVLKYFDDSNLVRPVYPDEPCPCGSGLSYRLCHGKYVS